MGDANIEIIRNTYESFGRGDIPAVLGALADDIVWTVPPVDGWGGTYRGRDAVLGFFASLPERYGPWDLRPEEFLADGDTVVARGRHCFPDGDEIPFAMFWTVRDGRAVSFQEYVDNTALLRHVVTAPATRR